MQSTPTTSWKMDQGLWALQPLDVAVQRDAIPAGVDELDSWAQEL